MALRFQEFFQVTLLEWRSKHREELQPQAAVVGGPSKPWEHGNLVALNAENVTRAQFTTEKVT